MYRILEKKVFCNTTKRSLKAIFRFFFFVFEKQLGKLKTIAPVRARFRNEYVIVGNSIAF